MNRSRADEPLTIAAALSCRLDTESIEDEVTASGAGARTVCVLLEVGQLFRGQLAL